jgi:hypothetical protein
MKSIAEFKAYYMNASEMQYIIQKGYAILDQQNVHIKLRKIPSDTELSLSEQKKYLYNTHINTLWKNNK